MLILLLAVTVYHVNLTRTVLLPLYAIVQITPKHFFSTFCLSKSALAFFSNRLVKQTATKPSTSKQTNKKTHYVVLYLLFHTSIIKYFTQCFTRRTK